MSRNATNITVTLAALVTIGVFTGCQSTQTVQRTKRTNTDFYRTCLFVPERDAGQAVALVLGAGDPLGLQVRDAYIARAEGTTLPDAEPIVVAQTQP